MEVESYLSGLRGEMCCPPQSEVCHVSREISEDFKVQYLFMKGNLPAVQKTYGEGLLW